MESATWIEIWSYVFLLACAFFFGTVAVVALRGFGDVADMIRAMMARRRES